MYDPTGRAFKFTHHARLARQPNTMRLEYDNDPDEFRSINAAFPRRQRILWQLEAVSYILLGGLPVALLLIFFDNLSGLIVGSSIILAWVLFRLYFASNNLAKEAALLRHMVFDSQPDSLRVEIQDGWSERDWSLVHEMRETDQHILVLVSTLHFYPVNKAVFRSETQLDEFRHELEGHIAAAKQRTELKFQPTAPAVRSAEGPLPAQSMQVQYQNTAREFFEANQFANAKQPQKSTTRGNVASFIVLVGISVVMLNVFRDMDWFVKSMFGVLAFFTLLLAFYIPLTPLLRLSQKRRIDPSELEKKTVTISADGIHVVSRGFERFSYWSMIERVAATDETIVIYDYRPHAHTVVQTAAFQDPQQASDFARLASVFLDSTKPAANLAIEVEETGNPYQPPAAT